MTRLRPVPRELHPGLVRSREEEGGVCPHVALSRASQRANYASDGDNRCLLLWVPDRIPIETQDRFCLSSHHRHCSVFRGVAQQPPRPPRALSRFAARKLVAIFLFAIAIPAAVGVLLALVLTNESSARSTPDIPDAVLQSPAVATVPPPSEEPAEPVASPSAVTSGPPAAEEPAEPVASPSAVTSGPPAAEELPAPADAAAALNGTGIAATAGAPTESGSPAPANEGGLEGSPASPQAAEIPAGTALSPEAQLRLWPNLLRREVEVGDTLFIVAQRFGTTPEAIAYSNGLANTETIFVGEVLVVPLGFTLPLNQRLIAPERPLISPVTPTPLPTAPDEPALAPSPPTPPPATFEEQLLAWPFLIHWQVRPGDSLLAIAEEFGTTPEAIARYNGLPGGERIIAGATITVPLGFTLPLNQPLIAPEEPAGTPPAQAPATPEDQLRVWPHLIEWQVLLGDSLFVIAQEFGTSPEAIARYNGLPDPASISVGQTLVVPVGFTLPLEDPERAPAEAPIAPEEPADTPPAPAPATPEEQLQAWPFLIEWEVRPGDFLFAIAQEFRTTLEAVARYNGLLDPADISVGQTLVVPVGFTLPLEEPEIPTAEGG